MIGLRFRRNISIVVALLAGVSPLSISAGAHAQSAKPGKSDVLEEVVVTAERRENKLQRVPIAVTAFTATDLERKQTADINAILRFVPNLIGAYNVGQSSGSVAYLRGVGTGDSILTTDPEIGYYIDDVYMARQGVLNVPLYDVERVEVLRGPQGALYGRNSNAGAIKVITKKPDLAGNFGDVDLEYGSFNRFLGKANGNFAFPEYNVAFRLSGVYSKDDGWGYDVPLHKDVNRQETNGQRIASLWQASDKLTIYATADRLLNRSNGAYTVDAGGSIRPVPSTNDQKLTYYSGTNNFNITGSEGGNVTAKYDYSPQLKFESVSAYRLQTQKYLLDLSDRNASQYNLYTDYDSGSFSQELKASGSLLDNKLDYVAGVFFFLEHGSGMIGNDQSTVLGPAVTPAVRAPYTFAYYSVQNSSISEYGELNWHAFDRFTLTAGGRYTSERRTLHLSAYAGGQVGFQQIGGTLLFNPGGYISRGVPDALTFSKFAPKVQIKYDLSDTAELYIGATNGFRSGGYSARTTNPARVLPFQPEDLWSYTIGEKWTFLDGRARLNSEGFYYDYKNQFVSGNVPNSVPLQFLATNVDSTIYGGEFEGAFQVTSELSINAFLGLQNGKRNSLPVSGIGYTPQNLPHQSYGIGANYIRDLAGRGNIALASNYTFQADHFTNAANIGRSGEFKQLDLSLSYTTSDDKYSFGVACKNCLDQLWYGQLQIVGPIFGAYTNEPRSVYGSIKVRF